MFWSHVIISTQEWVGSILQLLSDTIPAWNGLMVRRELRQCAAINTNKAICLLKIILEHSLYIRENIFICTTISWRSCLVHEHNLTVFLFSTKNTTWWSGCFRIIRTFWINVTVSKGLTLILLMSHLLCFQSSVQFRSALWKGAYHMLRVLISLQVLTPASPVFFQ